MKYYLIVGEASGDLHASHLMTALKAEDPQADFRFFGGDLMAAVGGTMVKLCSGARSSFSAFSKENRASARIMRSRSASYTTTASRVRS